MPIFLKRVYEPPSGKDGCRILVERLWPRGLSREEARIDLWAKEAAPSTELRRWFSHEPEKWEEFVQRYRNELEDRGEVIELLREQLRNGPVTFVFAAKETRFNNAVALREYLKEVD